MQTQAGTVDSFDESAKIVVVGPQNSGKTCLVQRCLGSEFCECDPTFGTRSLSHLCIVPLTRTYYGSGVDFRLCTIPVDGRQTRMHLWDTTGSDRFSKITHAYYRVAQGILLVYDATDFEAMEQINDW